MDVHNTKPISENLSSCPLSPSPTFEGDELSIGTFSTVSSFSSSTVGPMSLDPQAFSKFFSNARNTANNIETASNTALAAHRTLSKFKEVMAYSGSNLNDLPENFAARVEDLIALLAGLMASTNAISFLSVLHLYVRTHFPGSVLKLVWEALSSCYGDVTNYFKNSSFEKLHTQAGGTDDEVEDFISKLRNAMTNWRDHRSGAFASKLGNIANILVTFGFFPDLDEQTFRLGSVDLYKARLWDVQKNAFSFTDMIIDTLMFFVERGYAAWKHKDFTLLLYSDTDASKLETEYALLVSAQPLIDSGRLADLGEDFQNEQDYEQRLEQLIFSIITKMKLEKFGPAKNVLANRLVVLQKIRTSLILALKRSPIREKPYGIAIFGGSAVGKSNINAIITKVLLHHNNFPSSKEHIVTLNDNDKFQSEYKAYHTAVCMDDHGNTRAEHYDGSPVAKIIDFLNNVPKAALNPNVELKGNVMIRPRLVTLTTNVKHLLAHVFSNEPVSILRRFNVFLDVRLKPECVDTATGGVDPSTMHGFIPDCWDIDVQQVVIHRTNGTSADKYEFKTLLASVSLFDALEYMKEDSSSFYAQQASFVENIETLYDMELCEHSYDPQSCPHCKLDHQAGVDFFDASPGFVCHDEATAQVEASIVGQRSVYVSVKDAVQEWYTSHGLDKLSYNPLENKSLIEVLKEKRSEILTATCMAIGITTSMYMIIKMMRTLFTEQLDLNSADVQPPVRLDTDVPNPWKNVKTSSLPRSIAGSTATSQQVINCVSDSIAHVYVYDDIAQKRMNCDIVPMGGNFWLLPGHVLAKEQTYRVEVQSTRRDTVGKNFTDIIDPSKWVRLGGDFVLVCLVRGGSTPDLSKWLVEEGEFQLTSPIFASTIHKDAEGMVDISNVKLLERKVFMSKAGYFDGVSYNYTRDTGPGLCMMALVPQLKCGRILGFHLAGRNNTSFGVSGLITKTEVDKAIVELRLRYPLTCHSEGTFPTEKYGIDYSPTAPISGRHASKWQQSDDVEQQPVLQVYGAHGKGTTKFISQIKQSPISNLVDEIMDLPRKHGAPSGQNIGQHWSRDLTQMSHPKGDFVPTILSQARDDLVTKIENFCDTNPEQLLLVHPYPKAYVLSGMDGVTSVDRVELNSSMGWPLNKKKKFFMGPVQETHEGISEPVDFEDPQYWEEVERMEQVLSTGERIHAIHRGNLKDEATKFSKNKIRVFAGCEFAFTCLVRKYYLSIVRLIQSNWKEFECAVGINAHGPQWSELTHYLIEHGTERMIAGDYKAFDKAVTPEIMLSSFHALISIAKRAGYTTRQLTIMRGIATEISYPLYEFDGVFLQLFGSNPSGHPLTVIINNLNNSLYMRYAYYALHEKEIVPPFDKVVSLMNYGDDNAMSVSLEEKKFNHTSIAAELAKVGITYTMAEKEAESVPFQSLWEISFLKRSFRFNKDLNNWTAPLELDSISKSLHNFMNRKGVETLPAQIAAQAIQAANMEFFYFGPDVFRQRHKQLLEVAERADIMPFVGDLPSYSDLTDRYNGTALRRDMIEEPDVPLDHQCGEEMIPGTFDYGDHCLGTGVQPFFWWEHFAANLSPIFFIAIWYMIYSDKISAHYGFPSTYAVYFLIFTCGADMYKIVLWAIRIGLQVCCVPFLIRHCTLANYTSLILTLGNAVVELVFSVKNKRR